MHAQMKIRKQDETSTKNGNRQFWQFMPQGKSDACLKEVDVIHYYEEVSWYDTYHEKVDVMWGDRMV